jgi:FkbM family methyltransferase
MPIDDGPGSEPEWSPGVLGRVRALLRRTLVASIGDGGERRFHGWYHRFLRAIGRFDPPEDDASVAALGAIAARSLTIIDIGANVGRYAWFLRRHAPAEARLFALEPHPGAVELLHRVFDGRPRSTILELAASDTDGTAGLVVPDGAFGSPVSGLAWIDTRGVAGPAANGQSEQVIHIRRLDGLVADGRITLTGPVFIKIDVEGGERRVLRGATDLLRSHRPIIYFECQATSLARQGETPDAVWTDLRQAGYRMFGDRSGRLEAMSTVDASIVNYLAIPDLPGDAPLDATTLETVLDAWALRTTSV